MKFITRSITFLSGIVLGVIVGLFLVMLLTKPASAQWTTWPTTFATRLLTKTTAAEMREYLGINVGAPGDSSDGTEAEMTTDEDYIYVSLGEDVWVQVAVDDVVNPIKLETGSYVLMENSNLALTE